MQKTTKYEFNLIELNDSFIPDPLNENAEKTEAALSRVEQALGDHSHSKSDITDFPASLPASDVPAWAKAASKPSYTASEVGAVSLSGDETITGLKTFTQTQKSQIAHVVTYHDVASYYDASGSFGTICITLPNKDVMFDMDIVYQGYNNIGKISLRGYTYASGNYLHLPKATGLFSGVQPTLRYANNSNGNRCILLGTTSTQWGSYLHVTIPRCSVGHNYYTDFSGIEISLLTDESGLTNIFNGSFNDGMTFSEYDSVPKMAAGSYVGTGTYGEDHKNSLTFDFVPKAVIIMANACTFLAGNVLINGLTETFAIGYSPSTSSSVALHLNWEGNTVSWWVEGSTEIAASSEFQYNKQGITYHYIALG